MQQRVPHTKKLLVTFVALAMSVWIAGCSRERAETVPAARSIETIADEYLAVMLQRYPEYGTYYAIAGIPHDRLTDNSLEALAAWQNKQDAWLEELDAITTPAEVGSRDWVTYGILTESLAA
ncbi:MAG: hypothetical protein RLN69_00635 [Woeseiaceae bacterium]